MNHFVKWVMTKILLNLTNHEGCEILLTKNTNTAAKATIQDSLGFIYEVELRCIGRIKDDVQVSQILS